MMPLRSLGCWTGCRIGCGVSCRPCGTLVVRGSIVPTSSSSSAIPGTRTAERCTGSRQNGGRMSQIEPSAVRNRLLAALPPDGFAALAPALRPVELDFRQTLHRPDRPLEAAYFVESGMVSMLAPLEEGQTMEVGIIGSEGLVGLPIVLGADSATTEALVQMQGDALRVPAAELRDGFGRSAALSER